MRWNKEYYSEIVKMCTAERIEKGGNQLQKCLEEMAREYLYESLRNYQRKEKELLHQKIRRGQKFSNLFSRTAQSAGENIFFSMGLFAGIVKVMEFLFRDLVDRQDFAHKIQGLCQKAHYLNVMKYLYRNTPARHREIVQREGVSRSHLTEIMKELQEAHVVDKYYQGKAAFYELTEEGREYVKTIEEEAEKPAIDYLSKGILGAEDTIDFRKEDYLEKIQISAAAAKKKRQWDCYIPLKETA